MGDYDTDVYIDVFKEAYYLSSPVPNCRGGDYNNPTMETCASSTVNMGTGRLSHCQELFTLAGAPLPLSVTLYYRSIPFAPSSIGNGWSHSYEATLQNSSGYGMFLWFEGKRRIYNRYTSTGDFVPPKGDYSTLVKNANNTWTVTELDGLKRNFDSTYRLTSIFDRYGNTLNLNYTDNKLTSVSDVANGRSVTFGYNGTTGKLVTITDPKLNIHTLGYTGSNLTSVTPPGDKGHWSYTYNASNGLLETKKDPADNTSSYVYYPSSTLEQTATDPNLKHRDYTYPTSIGGAGKIPDYFPVYLITPKTFNFVEKDGNGWTYTFDTLTMNVRTATDPLGKATTYYYNTDGTLRGKTVPYNDTVHFTTFYAYDSNGNLTGETDPLDLSLPQYAGINPAEVNTSLITATSTPIAWAKNYTYDTSANYYQIKTITDNRGTTPLTTTCDRSTELGGQLRVTKTTAPGETTGTTLISYQRQNANGTMASITDANGKTTSFAYYPVNPSENSSGMLQIITTPDNIKLTYTAYDKNGNPTEFKLTDANNADIPVKSTQGYDTLNRIVSILKE
jgi:YD repeat-containing protein